MAKFIPITIGTTFNSNCVVTALNDKGFAYTNHNGKPDHMSYSYWGQFASEVNAYIIVKIYSRGKLIYPNPNHKIKTFFKLDQ